MRKYDKEIEARLLIEQARQLVTQADQIPKTTVKNLKEINKKLCSAYSFLLYAAMLLNTTMNLMLIERNEVRLRLVSADIERLNKQIEAKRAKRRIKKLLDKNPIDPKPVLQINALNIAAHIATQLRELCNKILVIEPKNKKYKDYRKQARHLLADVHHAYDLLHEIDNNLVDEPLRLVKTKMLPKSKELPKNAPSLMKTKLIHFYHPEIKNLYINMSNKHLENLQQILAEWVVCSLRGKHSFLWFKSKEINLNLKSVGKQEIIEWINESKNRVAKCLPTPGDDELELRLLLSP